MKSSGSVAPFQSVSSRDSLTGVGVGVGVLSSSSSSDDNSLTEFIDASERLSFADLDELEEECDVSDDDHIVITAYSTAVNTSRRITF